MRLIGDRFFTRLLGPRFIKRWLPRSLFGRSLLIIILPMGLMQIAITLVLFNAHWETVTGRLSEGLAGDIAWAGVGCPHSFRNLGAGNLRWLETQAPQPPPRYSYRFARDWDYLREVLR